METILLQTYDGSHTLYVPSLKEHYHSVHGAVKESGTVFVRNGLLSLDKKNISILEIGFGTGLNAFLTYLESKKRGIEIRYTGIEPFPLPAEIYSRLNYAELLDPSAREVFLTLHECSWDVFSTISEGFQLKKVRTDIRKITYEERYDLIYFDAFAPDVQPELWKEEIFQQIAEATKPGGVLVTYSSKAEIRRRLKKTGFEVSKLPGPPGKREVIRAVKTV